MASNIFSIIRIANSGPIVACSVNTQRRYYDTHNNFNPSNCTYTIPISGTYEISVTAPALLKNEKTILSLPAGHVLDISEFINIFAANDWIYYPDMKCVGIYKGENIMEVVDSKILTHHEVITIDIYKAKKIPPNSTYAAIRILYDEK